MREFHYVEHLQEIQNFVDGIKELAAARFLTQSEGNMSFRIESDDDDEDEGGMLISASSVFYRHFTEEHVIFVPFSGGEGRGKYVASSEAPFHEAIYKARKDVKCIIHCHTMNALKLSQFHEGIQRTLNYQMGRLGGTVLCTPGFDYPGTEELAEHIVRDLGDRYAVLIGGHGHVGVGDCFDSAYEAAELVETRAELKLSGCPDALTEEQAEEMQRRYKAYLQQRRK